jgi:uncharacterized protein (TIGR03435 family)
MNDTELLQAFAGSGAEDAFGELVNRHINFVYSVARRNISDTHLAEEVVQTVFIILARKAASLTGLRSLTAWLQRTTRLAALEALRRDCRRRDREEKFAQMDHTDTEPIWEQIAPHLDELMLQLGETDRLVVALRFFESKSFQDVGHALGTGEDAARMRVNRALEKLRSLFARRGVVVPAAALLVAVSAHGVQAAPAGLAANVAATSLAQGSAIKTSAVVKGTLKLMAWTQAKTAIVAGVAVLLAAGTATVTVSKIVEHRNSRSWWEIEKARLEAAYSPLPQVMLAPTKFPRPEDQTSGDDNGRPFGTGSQLTELVDDAYSSTAARTVLPDDAPQDRYDFIADLQHGAKESLQKEIEKQLGLVARHEMRETDVLLLTVKNPHAPGLKRAASARDSTTLVDHPGKLTCVNQRMSGLAYLLEYYFRIPVIDRTGIKGRFDMTLQWHEPDPMHHDPEAVKQTLLDQLGLELVPSRESINMLVVEKADN